FILAGSDRSIVLRRAAFRRAVLPPSPRLRRERRVGVSRNAKCPMGLTTGHFTLATSYSHTACRRTTIGAAAFHFRVRNGNGWCHCATVTRAEKRLRCSALVRNSRFVKRYIDRRPTGPWLQRRFTILNSR